MKSSNIRRELGGKLALKRSWFMHPVWDVTHLRDCLGFPQEKLEDVAKDKGVWAALLRLLPPQARFREAMENEWMDEPLFLCTFHNDRHPHYTHSKQPFGVYINGVGGFCIWQTPVFALEKDLDESSLATFQDISLLLLLLHLFSLLTDLFCSLVCECCLFLNSIQLDKLTWIRLKRDAGGIFCSTLNKRHGSDAKFSTFQTLKALPLALLRPY